ncbi:MAG: hypothetical protein RLZZ31_704 [Actinomycetota bacterium]
MKTPPEFPQRLVYLGTPTMAVPPLEALVENGFSVELVVTRPDKRRGRGSQLLPSPVKEKAIEFGVTVTDDLDEVREVDVDLAVVVAYGRIIPTSLLELVPMVNLHFSLLPRWRGAAPVERAILAGDRMTGVCLMQVEPTLDTGAVYSHVETEIGVDETAEHLRRRLSGLGSQLLVESLRQGLKNPTTQSGETTYAEKLTSADFRIDWSSSTEQILRVVRVGNAATMFRDKNFKIHSASFFDPADVSESSNANNAVVGEIVVTGSGEVLVRSGDGWLHLGDVQPEGKPIRNASDWKNGAQLQSGERFT